MDSKTKPLQHQLAEARADLFVSLKAELCYGDQAREHRAEAANSDLSYHQRETQHRLYMQYLGQHNGQRAESDRLRREILHLQRLIQEDRNLVALSNAESLARLARSEPFTLPAELAEGMDLSMEAVL